MIAFDFRAFQIEFGLTNDFAAKVFAVSRRTVVRWRAQGLIPRSAWHLVLTIQRHSPPWTSGFARGHAVGICQLALPWREELFAPPGGQWQDYRTPQQRRDLARWREQAPARAEARAEAEKAQRVRSRMLAGRKIAEAHRRRREAAAESGATAGSRRVRVLNPHAAEALAGRLDGGLEFRRGVWPAGYRDEVVPDDGATEEIRRQIVNLIQIDRGGRLGRNRLLAHAI